MTNKHEHVAADGPLMARSDIAANSTLKALRNTLAYALLVSLFALLWFNAAPANAQTPPSLILDDISAPSAAAYSLRKLRAGYTGNAIRVRRSSDNAEANIGFATAAQTRTNLAAIPINNDGGSGGAGITMTTVGTGTEFGQPYVEVRWQGTAAANTTCSFSHGPQGAFNPIVHAPVTPGLTYAASVGYRLVAGTAPAQTPLFRSLFFNSTATVNTGQSIMALP